MQQTRLNSIVVATAIAIFGGWFFLVPGVRATWNGHFMGGLFFSLIGFGWLVGAWHELTTPRREWNRSLKIPRLTKQLPRHPWVWLMVTTAISCGTLIVIDRSVTRVVLMCHGVLSLNPWDSSFAMCLTYEESLGTAFGLVVFLTTLTIMMHIWWISWKVYHIDHCQPGVTWWRFPFRGVAVEVLKQRVWGPPRDLFQIFDLGTPFQHGERTLTARFYTGSPTPDSVTQLMTWIQRLPPPTSTDLEGYLAQAAQHATTGPRTGPSFPFWITVTQNPAN